jgi:quinolinate synthase
MADRNSEMIEEIKKLKKIKNAIILGHYYQIPEIQDISDFVGDSLYLSQKASDNYADIIVFAGVNFMAETAKMLSPLKKVLIPDIKAGCSLADSVSPDKFNEFLLHYPGYKVITYINSSAAVKAMSDVICTSTNAVEIVNSFHVEEKLIFAPDRNLGNFINSITGREMVLWDGSCHVHEQFSLEKILELKKQYPDAKIISHPECLKPILMISDFIGSTAGLLKYTFESSSKIFIIVTESGILHQMKKLCPDKRFIPAPPIDSTCGCNDCNFMKLNTLEKLLLCLENEQPEIIIDEELRKKAVIPVIKMLEISMSKGLIKK